MRTLVRSLVFSALVLAPLAGCGGGVGDVSGVVDFGGKPVKVGDVTFYGPDNVPHGAKLDRDGKYSITGVPAGKARVVVVSPNPKGMPTLVREGKKFGPDEEDVKNWVALPKKYEDPATSGLEFDVKSGSNTIPINLK
ncbi:MAG: hypothetical protein U0793_32510 [Gemmataceae bacterium]